MKLRRCRADGYRSNWLFGQTAMPNSGKEASRAAQAIQALRAGEFKGDLPQLLQNPSVYARLKLAMKIVSVLAG